MTVDRKHLVCALVYAVAGMGLGIRMAITNNHAQFVTHAHVMLVGFVASLLYAIVYKLWLPNVRSRLAQAQFYIHQIGSVLMVVGLYLLYGGLASEATLVPFLAAGSLAVLLGVVLVLALVLKGDRSVAVGSDAIAA